MVDLDRIASVVAQVGRDIRDAAWDWETHGPACGICRAVLRACIRELMWCTAALEECIGAVPEPRVGAEPESDEKEGHNHG